MGLGLPPTRANTGGHDRVVDVVVTWQVICHIVVNLSSADLLQFDRGVACDGLTGAAMMLAVTARSRMCAADADGC